METRFFKVTSYVEVFVPTNMPKKEAEKLATNRVRDQDDMFMDNISVDMEATDDPFEFMSDSFRLAVDIFEEFDLEACRGWFEKARFNVWVCDE